MSLLTAAHQKRPDLGYAPDFVAAGVGPHLNEIKRQGIRVVANAGGINTKACAAALREACSKAGVDLKIAEVHGDNLMPRKKQLLESKSVREMTTGQPLPQSVHSMTAYFGAGPVIRALDLGADIVVTGRTADSSLALAPFVHEFGWRRDSWDLLAAGSLAGHLVECGGQATGGLFTDWMDVEDYDSLGFPVVEMSPDGTMVISKPEGTGGLLNRFTVAEQMLYEVGDPANYVLPDVVCDFSRVCVDQTKGGVRVSGARGKPATDSYKVCATYLDGFKGTGVAVVAGGDAAGKARKTAEAIMKRSSTLLKRFGLEDFDRTHISVIGAEDTFGASKRSVRAREAAVWMSVQHRDKRAVDMWSREIASAGTGMAPGLATLVGGRPKASPCLRLFSFLHPKKAVPATITVMAGEKDETLTYDWPEELAGRVIQGEEEPRDEESVQPLRKGDRTYRLMDLAYARSGDKGDSCNIGLVARDPGFLPYIKQAVTPNVVAEYFDHCFDKGMGPPKVERFNVPGIFGVNFLLHHVLDGGGIASLRPDPLGKAFGQMLLDLEIAEMPNIEELRTEKVD